MNGQTVERRGEVQLSWVRGSGPALPLEISVWRPARRLDFRRAVRRLITAMTMFFGKKM